MIAEQPDENPSRIEPARIETLNGDLPDLIAKVAANAERLGRSLHPTTASNLANLVRLMSTYYSNLIEGHNTPPPDIERALGGARDEGQRDLQQEAVAHELARSVLRQLPRTQVLIMSGYADATGTDPDLPRLTKPFRQADLGAALLQLSKRLQQFCSGFFVEIEGARERRAARPRHIMSNKGGGRSLFQVPLKSEQNVRARDATLACL
jgi:hypothetical protein